MSTECDDELQARTAAPAAGASAAAARECPLAEPGARRCELMGELREGVVLARMGDAVIVHVNPAFARMTGYEPGELLGRGIAMVNAARDGAPPDEVARRIVAAVDRGGAWEGTVLNRRKDGSTFWSHASVSTFVHPAHGPVYLSLVRDVTAERRAAERLASHEARMRELLDALPALIGLLGEDGQVLAANRSWRALAGDPDAPPLARPIGAGLLEGWATAAGRGEAGAAALARGTEAVLEGGEECFTLEHERRIAGETRWFITTVTPLREARGAAVVHLDVTERRRAQTELARQREELAHAARVASVSHLASGIAHELSQPLSALMQFGAAAERGLEGVAGAEGARDLVRRCLAQAQRAAEIVHHLRGFVRPREEPSRPESVGELCAGGTDLVAGRLRRDGIELRLDCPADLPRVLCRAIQVEQVLVNLLTNSVEALRECPGGRGAIRVSARARDGYVQVSVEDDGPGLDAARAARLFEAYETSKPDGLGLGLALSRSMIEAQGGRMWADAGHPGGALFHFTLPVAGAP